MPRYTAEGYPSIDGESFPSPPEGYKTEGAQPTVSVVNSQNYCSNSLPQSHHHQQQPQWPSCLPGYHTQGHDLKRYPSPQPHQSPVQTPTTVTKKCVGAQTGDYDKDVIHEQEEEEEEEPTRKIRHLTGPLADSPDEGYVGDTQESVDI